MFGVVIFFLNLKLLFLNLLTFVISLLPIRYAKIHYVMDFQKFIASIPKIENEMLLAEKAHVLMVPPDRKDIMQNLSIEEKNPRKAGVLMLLYPKGNKLHLVLIERNAYIGVHSSQIALPGGKMEPQDQSIVATTLRETNEEIGIPIHKINIIKTFSQVYIPPSNFLVFPFLGYATEELQFVPDPKEVAAILEVSIAELLQEATMVNKLMTTSYSTSAIVPAFKIQDYYIWGATAMILSELKEVLKKVL